MDPTYHNPVNSCPTGSGLLHRLSARRLYILAVLGLSVVLPACSSGSSTPGDSLQIPSDSTVVNVTANISGFTLDKTSLDAGKVTFVITDSDHMPHDFQLAGNCVNYESKMIDSGQSTALTADLAPGTYTYTCTLPGHGQSMHGTLTVK